MDALDQAIAAVDGPATPLEQPSVPAPQDGDELANPSAQPRDADAGLRKKDVDPLNTSIPIREPTVAGEEQPEQPATPVEDLAKEEPAQPQAPRDALDAAIAKVDGTAPSTASAGPILSMRAELAGPDAARTRDVLHYAELYGVPADVIERNLDFYKAHADETAKGWLDVARSNPALAQWAIEGHGLRAGAVKDDLRNLSNLEWAWRAPFAAFKDAAWMLDADAREAMVARGWQGAESAATAKQIENEHSGVGYGEESAVGHAATGLAQALPWMAVDEVGRLAGGQIGRLGGAIAGAIGTSETGPGALGGAAGGAALGATVGQFGGSFAVNDTLLLGQLNREFSQMRDADGNPLDPQVAHWASEMTAGLTSTAMSAMGPFGNRLGKVIGEKALGAVEKLLLERGVPEAVLRYGGRFGAHELSALALGLVQGGLSGSGREGAKLFSGQRFNLDPGSIIDDAFSGATNSARDMLLLSGVHAVGEGYQAGKQAKIDRAIDAQKAQTAATAESSARLQAINDAAGKSASIPGMPAKDVDDLVSQIASDPRSSHVLIDREAVVRLAQERNVDPAEIAKSLVGDQGEAWETANRTGGELTVPAAPYVRFAAKDKEGAGALFQDARLFSEAQTPRQARAADEQFQKDMRARATVPPEEMEAPQRAVYDEYREKAEAAGVSEKEADANARIVAATFHTWAERFRENGTDTDALDLFRSRVKELNIRGPRGQMLDTSFNPDDLNLQTEPTEHPVIDEVRQEYANHLEHPETEVAIRRYYEDPVTGLRNQRAADLEPKDPNKPAVLHFGVEGVKFRNDDLEKGGHNKADELLRAVAQAAHQIDPNVYRTGGDFAVPVKDASEGEAFLQLIRENLPEEAKGYGISGKTGVEGVDDKGKPITALTAARTEHDKFKVAAEGSPEERDEAGNITKPAVPATRASRGERPFGLPEGHGPGTTIPGERVKAQLGEHHQKAFDEATSTDAGREKVFQQIHVEQKTGLLTRAGFDALPKRKFRAAIDLNGLKRVQEELAKHIGKEDAHAFGDEMLERFGQLAEATGALDLDFAHDHGDEYLAQADDEDALKTFLGRLFDFSRETDVVAPDKARGGTWTYKSLIFGFGTGETAHENQAERALNKHKEDLKLAGLRGNEDQPERLFYTPPGDGTHAPDEGGDLVGSGNEPGAAARGHAEGRQDVRPSGSGEPGEEGPNPGAGSSVDEGGRSVGGADRPLDVAPGVTVHAKAFVPSESDMAAADGLVSRLKSPERRKQAAAFLDRVRAYLAGEHVGSVIGDLPRDLENRLAKFVVDPKDGYVDTEALRRQSRGGERGNPIPKPGTAEHARAQDQADEMRRNFAKDIFGDDYNGGRGTLGQPEVSLESRRGRGEINFTPPGTNERRTFNIRIFSGADTSTLAHETFHFLNQVMGDLAQRGDAPELLKNDYAGLIKFMGYDSHEQRVAETKELIDLGETKGKRRLTNDEQARETQLRAKEERATFAWEKFLQEGRTPSVELAGVFQRFANWLTRIYKTASLDEGFRKRFGEDLGMTDEVRQIFGRFVAAEDEVAKAAAAAKAQPFSPLFENATPEERKAYEDAESKKRALAWAEMVHRIATAQKEENNDFFRGEAERIRGEVNDKLDNDPIYRAIKFLKDGEMPGGHTPPELLDEHGEPYRLDRRSTVEGFAPNGKEFVKTIVEKHGNLFAKKGEHGMPPDMLASLLGFDSGEEMLRQIQAADSRKALVENQVKAQMTDLHAAPLLESPQALAEEAIAALHNPEAVRAALLERRRLAKMLAGDRAREIPPLSEETLRSTARAMVSTLTMSDLLAGREGAAGGYRRNERTASERMRRAFEAGKVDEALAENETRLLNMFLWREAKEQREHFQGVLRELQQSAADPWRQQLGKADVAAGGDHVYRDAHDALLQAIKLQPRDPALEPKGALEALVGATPPESLGFDPDALRALLAAPKSWNDLTPDDAQNVRDAVKSIRHAANTQNSIEAEGKRQSMDQFFADANKQLEGLPKATKERMDRAREEATLRKAATLPRRAFQWVDSNLMNIETLLDVLTGNKRDSVLHKLFIDGQLKSRDAKEALGREFLDGLQKHWEEVTPALKKRLNEVVDISELAASKKFQDLAEASGLEADGKVSLKYALMMALNMGNAGNKQRLLDGYGWNEDQVMRTLDRVLPKEGWDWVQGVWDSLESLWPKIARVHELETGVEPGKVPATEVVTRHGTYKGGYFPAKYDPRTNSRLALHQVEAAAANMLAPQTYGIASVAKGHTQERAARFEDAIDLDWNVVPGHVANVLHYIAYRPWVRDAAKVVASDKFASLVDRHLGKEYTKQFDPWLKAVANMQSNSVAANQTAAMRAVGWLRSRIAVARLGLNLPVALTHLSYPVALATTGEVRPDFMAEAVGRTMTDWSAKREWALANSPELRFREEQVGGLLRKSFDEMGSQGSPLQREVEHMAFAALEWGEKLTATPAWIARYNQELATHNDHATAVREADSMIRRWYISKSQADVPAIIRDKSMLGGLFMFYGYMNKMLNVQRRWARDVHVAFADSARSPLAKGGAAALFAGKVLALTLTQGVMSEYLGGKGREDEEGWGHWLFRKALVFQASLPPFIGEAVDALLLHKQISVRQSPGLATTQHVAQTIGGLVQGIQEHDKEKQAKAAWDALEQLGIFTPLTPLPTGKPVGTAKYLTGLATGQQHARGPGDVAGGVIYGDGRTSNPLTDAQSLTRH
ncbi:MAG: hypothetical protein JST54_12505 [Deltaproteobacteria bacterium]|nr:hypothetical protein [Deltaproteobacteria bacterium]